MARHSFVVIAAIAVAAACGGNTASSPTTVAETLALRLQTDHFRFFAGAAADSAIRAAADRVEADYARITSALGVANLPVISVRVWQDETTYFNELTRYFGVRYSAAGYITGPTELRLLVHSQLPSNVVHEFVHAASMSLNPSFPNNPRWLWEAVALYENGELVDPRRVDYLVRGSFPTLQQLNVDPNAGRQVYDVGYLLGDFIVSRWGRAAFLRLIQTNADLPGVLGMSSAEFESAWQSYVRQRYLS